MNENELIGFDESVEVRFIFNEASRVLAPSGIAGLEYQQEHDGRSCIGEIHQKRRLLASR